MTKGKYNIDTEDTKDLKFLSTSVLNISMYGLQFAALRGHTHAHHHPSNDKCSPSSPRPLFLSVVLATYGLKSQASLHKFCIQRK